MKNDEKMTVKPGLEKRYEKFVNTNQDFYGHGAVEAAAHIGRLLDKGRTCAVAESYGMRWKDLTAFLAGCAAQAVVYFHPRGEEFRKWWNSKYGLKEEDDNGGVVNPALLTITLEKH